MKVTQSDVVNCPKEGLLLSVKRALIALPTVFIVWAIIVTTLIVNVALNEGQQTDCQTNPNELLHETEIDPKRFTIPCEI